MIITSAQYILLVSNDPDSGNSMIKATIDGRERIVPITETNLHYAEIMRQVEAGELTISEAE
jgi:hypothetical protein